MQNFAIAQDPSVARSFRGHRNEVSSVCFHPDMYSFLIPSSYVIYRK